MIMSIEAWGVFFAAAIMLSITPGPDLVFILSRALAHGKKIGVAAALGVSTGALVHALAAALGLSAILATSATAFMVVKYIGAAYLIYLGIKALRAKEGALSFKDGNGKHGSFWSAFRQGMLIDVLNPKVAIFFMAFLPQFIAPEAGAIFSHTIILGLLVVLTGFSLEVLIILVAAPLGHYLKNNPKVALWLDRALGGLMVGLGARLAMASRV
ncbi:MAG: LysE family translocator [Cohaesibacter sp.]|jgi:threonine/homoserine/homoserine lactone efflux protein|nr:LysE family translocator [Cohaesibacter sp.]